MSFVDDLLSLALRHYRRAIKAYNYPMFLEGDLDEVCRYLYWTTELLLKYITFSNGCAYTTTQDIEVLVKEFEINDIPLPSQRLSGVAKLITEIGVKAGYVVNLEISDAQVVELLDIIEESLVYTRDILSADIPQQLPQRINK